jgi:hypothetical protein
VWHPSVDRSIEATTYRMLAAVAVRERKNFARWRRKAVRHGRACIGPAVSGVTTVTIRNWQRRHSEFFCNSFRVGKDPPNGSGAARGN